MKPHIREILADIKAAVRIGHADSIEAALEQVRKLPDELLPPAMLVPLGRALHPLPAHKLRPYQEDDDPAVRALAGVALAERWLKFEDVAVEDLNRGAGDPNPEVGQAVAGCLADLASAATPGQILSPIIQLASKWITSPNSNTILAGLKLFPSTLVNHVASATEQQKIYELFQPLYLATEHEVREMLVSCLNTIASVKPARHGDVVVLELLSDWAQRPEPNVWLITQVLSASWALNHKVKAITILQRLSAQAGLTRPIIRAIARFQDSDSPTIEN